MTLIAKIESRCIPEPNTGCWLWTGFVRADGYSQAHLAGYGKQYGHILSYEAHIGKVPIGLELDHLCRVRCCVNPRHLEAVTRRVNTLRGISPAARQARQTHCLRGHELSGANLYRKNRHRYCRACHRMKSNSYYAKKRSSVQEISSLSGLSG